MLEVKNLTRIYRSKTGQTVRALDGVDVAFPARGMVFILGKSGSGKSTLLNLMGGLDKFDAGEIIIKGRSSADFSQSDFDSYRNTYLGFIFQEYNILNDFTVGANVALALELQGKKATNEEINRILGQVDLLGYAKRKPNELSGGQKQRVAIARALVKNPEIIMADEPTGALDSNTGRQVFDTLKKLSQEKLVIIVSHDRDFAEKYADRIIEMADGKIFSDVTKRVVPPMPLSDAMEQMGDNVFRIRRGYRLTTQDLDRINAYLASNEHDLILSGDARLNAGVAESAGVETGGGIRTFSATGAADVATEVYDGKKTKFIRSRLPIRNAAKMGASSLGHKKFRLFMTILFSLIAFTLFGVADTASVYEKHTVTTQSILDSGIPYAAFSVEVKETTNRYKDGELDDSWYHFRKDGLNEDDLVRLRQETQLDFVPVYNGSGSGTRTLSLENHFVASADLASKNGGSVYLTGVYGFVEMKQETLSELQFAIAGRLPEAEEEVAIPKHLFNAFQKAGFRDVDGDMIAAGELTTDSTGAKTILGRKIKLAMHGQELVYTIVGVVDTEFDYQRYELFMPKDANAPEDGEEVNPLILMMQQKELADTLQYGFHTLLFLCDGAVDNLPVQEVYKDTSIGQWFDHMNSVRLEGTIPAQNEGEDPSSYQIYLSRVIGQSAGLEALKDRVKFFTEGKTELGEKEVIVSMDAISNLAYSIRLTGMEIRFANIIPGDTEYVGENGYPAGEYYQNFVGSDSFYALVAKSELALVRDFYLTEYPDWASYSETEQDEMIINQYCSDLRGNYSGTPALPGQTKSGEEWCAYAREELRKAYNAELKCNLSAEDFELFARYLWVASDYRNLDSFYRAKYAVDVYDSYKDLQVITDRVNQVFEESYPEDYTPTEKELREMRIRQFIEALGSSEDIWERNDWFANGKSGAQLSREASADSNAMILPQVVEQLDTLTFAYTLSYWMDGGENTQEKSVAGYKVVGYYTTDEDFTQTDLVVSDDLLALAQTEREYVNSQYGSKETYTYEYLTAQHESGKYAFAIAVMPTERDAIEKLVALHYDETVDVKYTMQNQVATSMNTFNDFIETAAPIFLYVGLGFALIAAFMLANFISTSISYKGREIGILRAVGARSRDVFMIFFSESFFIAMINFFLSIAGTIGTTYFINTMLREEAGLMLTLLNFGARQVVLLLALSIGIALLSSFLPVYKIAKKRPVDAINNR